MIKKVVFSNDRKTATLVCNRYLNAMQNQVFQRFFYEEYRFTR